MPSEQQTGYDEGCCWTWIRDQCKGQGCACRCHQEQPHWMVTERARAEHQLGLTERALRAETQLAAANATIAARDAEVERFRENYRCAYEERAEYRKEVNWLKDQLAEARAALEPLISLIERQAAVLKQVGQEPTQETKIIMERARAVVARTPEAGGNAHRFCSHGPGQPCHLDDQQASQPEQRREG